MRFRIRARNPKTRQAHHFEVEGASPGDARDQVEGAGLVASSIEPVAEPGPDREGGDQETRRPRMHALTKRRRTPNSVLFLGILAAVVASVQVMLSGGATTLESLNASIRFSGSQFKIVNKDDFTWHDVRLDLNGGLTHNGYLHRPGTLCSDQLYIAPATAFVDEKGNRFNPVTETPRRMTITCDLEGGRTARYTRGWH